MVGNLLNSSHLQLNPDIDVNELALAKEVGDRLSVAIQELDGGGELARRHGHRLLLQEILDACR